MSPYIDFSMHYQISATSSTRSDVQGRDSVSHQRPTLSALIAAEIEIRGLKLSVVIAAPSSLDVA